MNNIPNDAVKPAFGMVLRVFKALLLLCAGAWTIAAVAQQYPSKPVRFILPSGPGGGTEIVTRMISQKLTAAWGQPVLVENRPGGNGLVAVQAFKSMPADGHALFLVNPFIGANAALFGKLPYDYKKDFQPVAVAFHNYFYFVVKADSQIDSVASLVRYAKAHPGELNFGAVISSISQRLWTELFNRQMGLGMVFIAYKTAGDAVQALASGQIQLMNVGLPAIEGVLRQGRVRVLAVGATKRSPATPDIPTVEEAGGPAGFVSDSWVGYVTHRGVPAAVVEKMRDSILAVLREPELVAFYKKNDYTVMDISPAEFGRLIDSDTERYSGYIRDLKLKPE